MEQHPVPQHIAAFKFKLFGNLTARQFFTLIIPLSLAALVFFSALPAILRIPISVVIGIFAFVIALIPFNGQPFDKWAVAFFRAVMSPTQRVWVKDKKIPDFLNVIVSVPNEDEKIPEEVVGIKKEKLIAYLKTLPQNASSPLDVKEQIALSDIDYSYAIPRAYARSSQPIPQQPPAIIFAQRQRQVPVKVGKMSLATAKIGVNLGTKPRLAEVKLEQKNPIQPIFNIHDVATAAIGVMKPIKVAAKAAVKITPRAKPYIVHGVDKRIVERGPAPQPILKKEKISQSPPRQYVQLIDTPTVNLASDTNYSLDNVIPIRTPNNQIMLLHGIGKTRARKLHFAPPVNFDLSKLPIRGEKRFEVTDQLKEGFKFEDESPAVVLPQDKPQYFPPLPRPPKQNTRLANVPKKAKPFPNAQTHQGPGLSPFQNPAQFSVTDLKNPVVNKPLTSAEIVPLTKTPNIISGLVEDFSGNPITGAVLVVRDANGIPQRALKTNKLGQFLSATPLNSGTYTIETESEMAKFRSVSLMLKGEIVPPIAIAAER